MSATSRRFDRVFLRSFACLLVLCLLLAPGARGEATGPSPIASPPELALSSPLGDAVEAGLPGGTGQGPLAAAQLEQCVTAVTQSERSATFSGEMTAIPGTVRMAMRIDVQAQAPGEAFFHTVNAPGLGVWRASEPGVKTYRYLKQVTNLPAPALYRAAVRFHWLNANGRLIRVTERNTSRCEQPAPPPPASGTPSAPSAATTSNG